MTPLPVPLPTPEDCAIWNSLWGGCLLRGGRPRVWSCLAGVSINGDRRDAALMHVHTHKSSRCEHCLDAAGLTREEAQTLCEYAGARLTGRIM